MVSDNYNIQSGSVFRQALHSLCWNIAERGGLPVIFSMMRVRFTNCIIGLIL